MAWIYKKEAHSPVEAERGQRILLAIVFSISVIGGVISAFENFSNGAHWVGVGYLAVALLIGSLAAEPLSSPKAVRLRLLAVGLVASLWLVLFVIQVLVPLFR